MLGHWTLRLLYTCGHFIQQNDQFLIKILFDPLPIFHDGRDTRGALLGNFEDN